MKWTTAMFVCALLLTAGRGQAVVLGQMDDFQDGTVQNWGPDFAGVAFNTADAGPTGSGDHALLVTSHGDPTLARQGSRSTVLNTTQWTGDWSAAGITAIEFDAYNPNNFEIVLWLGIGGPGGVGSAGSGDVYTSLGSAAVGMGAGWSHMSINVTAADFENATNHSSGTIENALTNVTQLRIFHNVEGRTDPTNPNNFIGDVVDADFYLDNITAVPEPATPALLTFAALAVAGRRRRTTG